MNKETFALILNVALWNYVDGMNEEDIISHFKVNSKIARAGIKLSEYLQKLNLEVQHD